MTLPVFSLMVSMLSFAVSATTAWLTLLHRGAIKMTKPTFIAFLSHGGDGAKVFLRTLLYNSARRGQVIEGMFVRLVRDDGQQTFNVWSYGETGRLVRGSGLYVGQDGVTHDHHFVLSADASPFQFQAGACELHVFAMLVHRRAPLLLARIPLHLTQEQARALVDTGEAVYFDWEPDSGKHHAYVRPRVGSRDGGTLRLPPS